MRRSTFALAVLGVAVMACGGGRSPGPKGPTGSTGPTGPTGTTDPTGTTGPTGPTGPTSPTGTTGPTGPTGPTGTSACDGLVPGDPGAGVAFQFRGAGAPADAANLLCGWPVTDGHGQWIGLAMGLFDGFRFVSATTDAGWLDERGIAPTMWAGEPAPQPDGYYGKTATRSLDGFVRYDAKGVSLFGDPVSGRFTLHVAAIPHGGAVMSTYTAYKGLYQLVWMSDAGQERADATVPDSVELLAVSANGDTLAATELSAQARWYDASGAPETGWFPHGLGSAAQMAGDVVALADGSVVVGLRNGKPARFQPGVAGTSPAPDWLLARQSATVAAVRGGAGNAAATVKSAAGEACAVEIEILTRAGESCGTMSLHAPDPCTAASFGADRTVFTTGTTSGTAADGSSYVACAWHWWSGLLR